MMECASPIGGRRFIPMSTPIEIAQALWTLECFLPEDWPGVACNSLEQGRDGPALRQLAGLVGPTHFDIRELVPKALADAGMHPITARAAAIRYARFVSQQIVDGAVKPLPGAIKLAQIFNAVIECDSARDVFGRFYVLEDDYQLAAQGGGGRGTVEGVLANIREAARKALLLREDD